MSRAFGRRLGQEHEHSRQGRGGTTLAPEKVNTNTDHVSSESELSDILSNRTRTGTPVEIILDSDVTLSSVLTWENLPNGSVVRARGAQTLTFDHSASNPAMTFDGQARITFKNLVLDVPTSSEDMVFFDNTDHFNPLFFIFEHVQFNVGGGGQAITAASSAHSHQFRECIFDNLQSTATAYVRLGGVNVQYYGCDFNNIPDGSFGISMPNNVSGNAHVVSGCAFGGGSTGSGIDWRNNHGGGTAVVTGNIFACNFENLNNTASSGEFGIRTGRGTWIGQCRWGGVASGIAVGFQNSLRVTEIAPQIVSTDFADQFIDDSNNNDNHYAVPNQRTNYAPGTSAIAGLGVQLPSGTPSGEQEAWFGMTNSTDGYGIGIDSTGPFAFIDIGGTRTKVAQSDWNQDTLDGSGVASNPSGLSLNNFETGNVVLFDHLWDGHGEIAVEVTVVDTDTHQVELIKVHTFTEENDGMFEQPNVPIKARVENNGTAEALDLDVRTMHSERLGGEPDIRLNGVRRVGQDVDTSWEPLISWQGRTGWEHINVQPINILIASDTDLEVEVQLDVGLNGASFSTAPHTSDDETAVEYDTSATGFSSTGERRFVGQVVAAQGNQLGEASAALKFNLPSTQTASLAAKADAANAIVDSVVTTGANF